MRSKPGARSGIRRMPMVLRQVFRLQAPLVPRVQTDRSTPSQPHMATSGCPSKRAISRGMRGFGGHGFREVLADFSRNSGETHLRVRVRRVNFVSHLSRRRDHGGISPPSLTATHRSAVQRRRSTSSAIGGASIRTSAVDDLRMKPIHSATRALVPTRDWCAAIHPVWFS